jgi:S-adenosylmethionine/arginine decarboxylase-like enzyme
MSFSTRFKLPLRLALLAAAQALLPLAADAATPYQFKFSRNGLTVAHVGVPSRTAVELSSGALVFGSQNVSSTSPAKSVLISNTGNTVVSIDALTVNGPFNATTSCAALLAAGAYCAVDVTFSPVLGGDASGSVNLGTGAGLQAISLSGFGLVPLTAALSADASTVVAPTGILASTPVAETRDVTYYIKAGGNVGTLSANASLSGNPAFSFVSAQKVHAYTQVGTPAIDVSTCNATVTPNTVSNCLAVANGSGYTDLAITVRYAPTVEGTQTATLSVAHNGANTSPLILGLSGTAVGTPTADLNSASLTFDAATSPTAVGSSTTQTVRLTNNGTSVLGLSAAPATSGDPAFSVAVSGGTTCGSSLGIGAYCDTTVRFSPASSSNVLGLLNFASSLGTKTVALSGTGQQAIAMLSTSSLALGTVTTGQSATSALVTLTNNGNIALSSLALTPTSPYTLASSTCSASLAAGASCAFAVNFAPLAVQSYPGTVTVTSTNGATKTLTVTGAGAAVADGNFAGVTHLLHMDGSNGSTSFVNSKDGGVVTGGATTSTARSKFGTASANMAGGTIPLGTLNLTGVFTLEYWLYPVSTATVQGMIGPNTGDFFIGYNGATSFGVARQGGWLIMASTGLPTANTWNHIAVTRDASNLVSVYVNGTRIASGTLADTFGNSAYRLEGNGGSYIDEFRLTKGVARYSGNSLTVPTGAFPNQ